MASPEALGVGMVGFGFIGKVHAHAYRSIPLFYDPAPVATRLVGVCTARAETAAKAVAQAGFEFGTTRFEELLARDDIHIIDVATPNHLHRPQIIAALEAGKHVYCDKPMAASLDGAERILAASRSARGKLQVVFQNRFLRPKSLKPDHPAWTFWEER